MASRMTCTYCGSQYENSLAECPRCGTPNPQGNHESRMTSIKKVLNRTAMRWQAQIRILTIVVIVVLLITLLAVYCYASYQVGDDFDMWVVSLTKEDYLWQVENLALWKEYYETEQYEDLRLAYEAAKEEKSWLIYGKWEHCYFTEMLIRADELGEVLQKEKDGETLTLDDLTEILYQELALQYIPRNDRLDEDEKVRLQPYVDEAVKDLESRFIITDYEMERFEDRCDFLGYVLYEVCEDYLQKTYGRK